MAGGRLSCAARARLLDLDDDRLFRSRRRGGGGSEVVDFGAVVSDGGDHSSIFSLETGDVSGELVSDGSHDDRGDAERFLLLTGHGTGDGGIDGFGARPHFTDVDDGRNDIAGRAVHDGFDGGRVGSFSALRFRIEFVMRVRRGAGRDEAGLQDVANNFHRVHVHSLGRFRRKNSTGQYWNRRVDGRLNWNAAGTDGLWNGVGRLQDERLTTADDVGADDFVVAFDGSDRLDGRLQSMEIFSQRNVQLAAWDLPGTVERAEVRGRPAARHRHLHDEAEADRRRLVGRKAAVRPERGG